MIREGGWMLSSVSDPRWNCVGTGMVAGGYHAVEAEAKVRELEKLYGAVPSDLNYTWTKD